jgi:hypothetical protein
MRQDNVSLHFCRDAIEANPGLLGAADHLEVTAEAISIRRTRGEPRFGQSSMAKTPPLRAPLNGETILT